MSSTHNKDNISKNNNEEGSQRRRFRIPTFEEIEAAKNGSNKMTIASNANNSSISDAHVATIDISSTSLGPPKMGSQGTGIPGTFIEDGTNTIKSTYNNNNNSAMHTTSQNAFTTSPGVRGTRNQTILVSERQRGNPLLECIRNVRWSYSRDVIADYVVGRSSCVLYLSIKYHKLHPEYISKRIESLHNKYILRVLLVYIDTDDCKISLREINRVALMGNMTLLLAWTLDEAGRYIESLKTFENRSPDLIREKVENTHMAKMTNALTSIRSVNKTDVVTLISNFRSFDKLAAASVQDLSLCPGIGDRKAQRIYNAMNHPFFAENNV